MADGLREESDYEPCGECKLPLPRARDVIRRLGTKTVCQSCYDLVDAISESQYMKEAQKNYRIEQQNKRKLKPGEDYLNNE